MRLILLTLVLLLAVPAEAQRYQQHAYAGVESPEVLTRGGVAAALPSVETGLFYNPAHLARVAERRARVEVVGVQGGTNPKLFGDLDFLLDDVIPAVEAGFSVPLSAADRALFDDALDRGRLATVGRAAVMLPRVTARVQDVGVSAGLFSAATARYRFRDVGGGIPLLDLFAQNDVILAVGAGTLIPETPLAVGVTARHAWRTLAVKHKDLLAISPDAEVLPVLTATTLAFDVGVHATDLLPALPGRLDAGLTLYDLVGGGMSYEISRTIELTGSGSVSEREAARLAADYDGRDGAMSFRAGVAYHLATLGPLATPSVGLDYVSASTSERDQSFLAHLRMGAEAGVYGPLRLRAGLSQGYPTFGAGVETRFVAFDYGFFGEEDGRQPGQLPRFSHQMRLRFGRF